jgi:hypothetical protein
LANAWIRQSDFLIEEIPGPFDIVAGNPPYVRQEAIDKEDLALYREQFACFYDRADLYMAFMEKGLGLLSDAGVLAFICPNRFTRNRYGKKLRALIVGEFRLIHYIDLAETSPFEPEVLAYPGIFVIGRGRTQRVRFVRMTTASVEEARRVSRTLCRPEEEAEPSVALHDYEEWFNGEDPWITESPAHLELIRRLEGCFPTLGSQVSGTRVGIGVATGADSIFIMDSDCASVESELLLPLVTTADCLTGEVLWHGRCVINPFKSETTSDLIDLERYPKAKAYFDAHRHRILKRNVAQRNTTNWYRTIDRIYPSLAKRPKLLIPDIKATNHIVYEPGRLYPHHNLYYIVSEYWDLLALRTILRSSLAKFFVWVYGVKMRSSFLRFQAQYLRRIRIPVPLSISEGDVRRLRAVDGDASLQQIDAVVGQLYGLNKRDVVLIEETIQGVNSEQSAEPRDLQ